MASNVAIRLGLEGGEVIKRGLDEVGRTGQSALDGIGAAADRAGTAADRTAERWKRMAQAAREAEAADRAQASINERLGVTTAPSPNASRSRQQDIEAAFAGSANPAAVSPWGRQAMTPGGTVPAIRLVPEFRSVREEIDKTTVANDNLTKSVGFQRYEWINLSRQMQDVVTMGAMGAPVGQIISSQAAQVVDIFTSAQAGPGAALRSVLPLAGAISGLAVTFGVAAKSAYDFSTSQKEIERATFGVGKESGATAGSITRMSDEIADAAKVSVGSAREMMTAFTRSGKINQDLFNDLTIVTARYAKGTGTDLPEASAKMAAALADPTKGALELTKELGFLNAATLTTIERQVALGDRVGAQRMVLDAMKTSLRDVTAEQNGWTAAIDFTIRKLKEGYDITGRRVMRTFAPTEEQQLATLTESRTKLSDLAGRGSWWSGLLTIGADKEIADLDDKIADLQERIRRRGAQAMADARRVADNDLSLRGKSIVDQFTPNQAEMLRLQTFKSTLEEMTRVGQGTTQTETTLKRINELLAAGGQAARDALRDAKAAADQAGMLPVPRARAQAEEARRRAVEAANGDPSLLKNAQDIYDQTMRGIGAQNGSNVVRDYTMRLDELSRSLKVQRDSFGLSTEAAETMRARLDMLTEAARHGQSVSERFGAGWEKAAADMGKAKAAAEELQRAQQNVIQGLDEQRAGIRGLATGVFSDLRQGKDPTQTIVSAAGRMTDQMFDRLVSRPFTENLLGPDGKAGGGWIGDAAAKMFGLGQSMTTASMAVQAAVVNIGGAGVGALVPGTSGSASGVPVAALNPASTLVRTSGGSVLSYSRAGAGAATFLPPGGTSPIPPVTSGAISLPPTPTQADLLLGSRYPNSTSPVSGPWNPNAIPRLWSPSDFPLKNLTPFRDNEWETLRGTKLGESGNLSTLRAGLERQITQPIETATNAAGGAIDVFKDTVATKTPALGGALTGLVDALGSVGKGAFSLFGAGGASAAGPSTGFSGGGYTGPGGVYEPRGIVHAGEVVWSQHDVARAGGPHVVDAMRRGVRGYSEGGIVPPSVIPASRVSMPRTQAEGGTTVQVSSTVHNYAGAQIEQRETRGPNGQIQLETFVRAAERRMASKASRNRGEAKDVFLTNQAAMNRG